MPGSTQFPAALDAFPDIGPNTDEAAVGVEHDVVHENVHAAVAALQAKVGVDGSADAGSLDARVAAVEDGAAERAQDALAAAFAAGSHSNFTVVYDDAANVFHFTAAGGGGGSGDVRDTWLMG